jgi:hypothetical protein
MIGGDSNCSVMMRQGETLAALQIFNVQKRSKVQITVAD